MIPITPRMEGLSATTQATRALAATLERIRRDGIIAWGFVDTESHALMLEALATLTDQSLDTVAANFRPSRLKDPVAVAEAALREEMQEEPWLEHSAALPTSLWLLHRGDEMLGVTPAEDVARSLCLTLSAEMVEIDCII